MFGASDFLAWQLDLARASRSSCGTRELPVSAGALRTENSSCWIGEATGEPPVAGRRVCHFTVCVPFSRNKTPMNCIDKKAPLTSAIHHRRSPSIRNALRVSKRQRVKSVPSFLTRCVDG